MDYDGKTWTFQEPNTSWAGVLGFGEKRQWYHVTIRVTKSSVDSFKKDALQGIQGRTIKHKWTPFNIITSNRKAMGSEIYAFVRHHTEGPP